MGLLCQQLFEEGLEHVAMAPRRRMETEARLTVTIHEKLLEIPRDVVHSNGVVHQLVGVAQLHNRLRARVLEELVQRVLVIAIHLQLPVDVP